MSRADVLVSGPMRPYAKSGNVEVGDYFALGGFDFWKDNKPDFTQRKINIGLGVPSVNDVGFSLMAAPTNYIKNIAGATNQNSGIVYLSRQWNQADMSASWNLNKTIPYQAIFFRWVHPTSLTSSYPHDTITNDCAFNIWTGSTSDYISGAKSQAEVKYPKDTFLLRAYYSASGGYPITSMTPIMNGNEYIYLYYNADNNYLQLQPMITAYYGGFLFDRSKFQFDQYDGMDGLPTWNPYYDNNRIIKCFHRPTTDQTSIFASSVEQTASTVNLNFFLMPLTWYNGTSDKTGGFLEYFQSGDSLAAQQCWRFNTNPTIMLTDCAIFTDFTKWLGVTQSNVSQLIGFTPYYVSEVACGGTTNKQAYDLITLGTPTNAQNYFNEYEGYCVKGSNGRFQTQALFPAGGGGGGADCTNCTSTTCGTDVCSQIANDSGCKDIICRKAQTLCGDIYGPPPSSDAWVIIVITILILIIFSLAAYAILHNRKHHTDDSNDVTLRRKPKASK